MRLNQQTNKLGLERRTLAKFTFKKFSRNTAQWQLLLIGFCIFVATFFVYRKVANYDFVNFDDTSYVTQNHHVQQGITLDNIIWAFGTATSKERTYWHPLTWMSHMLDWQLFGKNAGKLHLENLLIHIINALLLLIVLRQMTGAVWRSAFVAALFALHPLNVDSVAWIAERKNVLSTLFWMLTMLTYGYYAKRPSMGKYLIIFTTMILGIMAKPMLVTLPCVLLLMDFWPLCRFEFNRCEPFDTNHFAKSPVIPLVLEKLPLLILAFISIGLSTISLHNNSQMVSHELSPMTLRLENSLISYIKYILNIFFPHNLAFYYPFPDFIPLWQVLGAGLIITILSIIFILLAKKAPYLIVGWLWFLGTLLPVIGIVQGGLWPAMADRWAYVPAIGIFIMISWEGTAAVGNRICFRNAFIGIVGIIFVCLMLISNNQVSYWKNSITLFEHAISVSKNDYLLEYDLGLFLTQEGRIDEALPHYYASLKSNPNFDRVYNNLGNALAKKGRLDEAISLYRTALKLKPDSVEAQINIADALAQKGMLNDAIVYYLKALEIEPDNAIAHKNFGQVLFKQKKLQEAETQLKSALALNPKDSETCNLLGAVMVGERHINDAVSYFKKTIEINPESIDALYNLAAVYSQNGEYDNSISCFKKIIPIQPDNVLSYYNIACLYARQNKKEEAVAWLKKAVAHGYDHWEHLKADTDLQNIQDTEYYKSITK